MSESCGGLTPAPTTLAAAAAFTATGLSDVLLVWLIRMLLLVRLVKMLLLLACALLALIGHRMHAVAAAIRCCPGLVAVTIHSRAWPIGSEGVRAIALAG